jgi:hypothetical protein
MGTYGRCQRHMLSVWVVSFVTTYLDVGVGLLGVSRDGRLVGGVGLGRAGARDDDLSALGVPLRVVGLVQGNELVAHQVVARGKASGDRAGPLLVAANELGNVPARGRLGVEEDGDAVAVEAALVNLEPLRARAVAGAEGAGALVHPDHDGALAVRPLLPSRRDGVTWLRRSTERRRSATVAANLGIGSGESRVVVWPLPLDHIGCVSGREALVSRCEAIVSNSSSCLVDTQVEPLTLDIPCRQCYSW